MGTSTIITMQHTLSNVILNFNPAEQSVYWHFKNFNVLIRHQSWEMGNFYLGATTHPTNAFNINRLYLRVRNKHLYCLLIWALIVRFKLLLQKSTWPGDQRISFYLFVNGKNGMQQPFCRFWDEKIYLFFIYFINGGEELVKVKIECHVLSTKERNDIWWFLNYITIIII